MSNTSLEIIHEGWLTKSPPSKPIWRAVRAVPSIFRIYKDNEGHKVRGEIEVNSKEIQHYS